MEMAKKPVVVRVKRKASQEPIEAFWLEINGRPPKKPLLDISGLSLTDSIREKEDVKTTTKVLVQHVETVSSEDVMKDLLDSFLHGSVDSNVISRKTEEQRLMLKQNKGKQSQQRLAAIQKHKDLVKNARFEQIWKSRRAGGKKSDDMLHEICSLYDVERVDSDIEVPEHVPEQMRIDADDDALLCNFLPLLKEYLPEAASDIESDLASKQGDFVYDIYAADDDMSKSKEENLHFYPLLQVNEDNFFYDDHSDSDHDSEDSNAENSDLHDYPDEKSSEDEEEDRSDEEEDEVDLEDVDYVYEEEMVARSDEDKEKFVWRYR